MAGPAGSRTAAAFAATTAAATSDVGDSGAAALPVAGIGEAIEIPTPEGELNGVSAVAASVDDIASDVVTEVHSTCGME